ncbi:MAG TPA: amino acid permease [Mycobacteriales bacterium]|nr:amino acid permease [Mycobacteriales bacterium]
MSHQIGVAQGTALYVGAVLGAGVLALPALAAAEAGPASVLAWAGLIVLSVPVAVAFAGLGRRYPDGGGVATFVARAAGPKLSAAVGWWFYLAVPAGAPSAALVGGQYVAHALGWGGPAELAVAAVLLAGAFGSNYVGLRLSGRLQLLLVGMLSLLLLAAIVIAAPHARAANLTPFLPHGWPAVGSAASLLFFSFAGWEAVTHLSGEFRDPRRTLPIVTALAVVIVGVLYLGLALTSVSVLGTSASTSQVPLTLLLASGIGDAARWVTAVAAVLLTFGTMNAYIAGASRLGAALGRDGALPGWLARGGGAGEVPRRSLSILAAATGAVVVVALAVGLTLGQLMLAASACFVAVTLAGLGAAVKLLPRRTPAWWGAVVAFPAMAVVLAFSTVFLAWPLALMLGALAFTHRAAAVRPTAVVLPIGEKPAEAGVPPLQKAA